MRSNIVIPEVNLEAVAGLVGGLDAHLALHELRQEGAVGAAQQRHRTHVARPEQERRPRVTVGIGEQVSTS